MRKIKSMIVTFLTLIFLPVYGYAFQNEPNGFRDLYWGMSLEEVQENRETKYCLYESESNSVWYAVRLNDEEPHVLSSEMIYGRAFIAKFWNNKLWAINIYLDDDDAYESLKFSMNLLYGSPDDESKGVCRWIGEKTLISLTRDEFDPIWNKSVINMGSIKVLNEMHEEIAKQGW